MWNKYIFSILQLTVFFIKPKTYQPLLLYTMPLKPSEFRSSLTFTVHLPTQDDSAEAPETSENITVAEFHTSTSHN
jgi:hypothetical protein